VAAGCACGDPYQAEPLIPVIFAVSTDDKGMVVLRAVTPDGQPTSDLRLCPHEAFDAARELEANARLAALEREQES
jgi:hypothetical protein